MDIDPERRDLGNGWHPCPSCCSGIWTKSDVCRWCRGEDIVLKDKPTDGSIPLLDVMNRLKDYSLSQIKMMVIIDRIRRNQTLQGAADSLRISINTVRSWLMRS